MVWNVGLVPHGRHHGHGDPGHHGDHGRHDGDQGGGEGDQRRPGGQFCSLGVFYRLYLSIDTPSATPMGLEVEFLKLMASISCESWHFLVSHVNMLK